VLFLIHTTHAAFGAALMETILVSQHAPLTWQAAGAVLASSVVAPFPDIDHPESWVTQHVPFGFVVSKFTRHRTLTHSLAVTVALYLLLFDAGLGVPRWLATGIVVGWLSHWLIDLAVEVDSLGETIIRLVLQLYVALIGTSYVLLSLPASVREYATGILPYASRVVETFSWPWMAATCHFLHFAV
jgi:inner membrane protein